MLPQNNFNEFDEFVTMLWSS